MRSRNVSSSSVWTNRNLSITQNSRNRSNRLIANSLSHINQLHNDFEFDDDPFFQIEEFEENEEEKLTKDEIKLLKKMKVKESNSSCSICQTKLKNGEIIRTLPCNHIFHYKCLKPWFDCSVKCPLCRCNIREELESKLL